MLEIYVGQNKRNYKRKQECKHQKKTCYVCQHVCMCCIEKSQRERIICIRMYVCMYIVCIYAKYCLCVYLITFLCCVQSKKKIKMSQINNVCLSPLLLTLPPPLPLPVHKLCDGNYYFGMPFLYNSMLKTELKKIYILLYPFFSPCTNCILNIYGYLQLSTFFLEKEIYLE